jgi:Carboxypeptidase regulatory-like domain/TonB dependent receptor
MAGATRLLASATVGVMMVVTSPAISQAQAQRAVVSAVAPATPVALPSILGTVRDDHGLPVADVVVSALGSTTTIAVTDKNGRFEFPTLAPGPYQLRAHLAGYLPSRAQTVQVSAAAPARPAITLGRSGSSTQVLAAGIGAATSPDDVTTLVPAAATEPDPSSTAPEDRSETAWRVRHARRGVLKDVTVPEEFLVEDDDPAHSPFVPIDFLGKAVGSPARVATSFFADANFSGQVNLLTTGSFDSPQDFFSTDTLSRNIAYVRLGAPVGSQADWTARGAVNQSDISSWIVAGSYTTRAAAGHNYDIGLSYSTQRYDGGNLLALRDVSEGSRNAGTVYGYDSFSFSPALTLSYGAAYSRYDYLNDRSLVSPRVQLTMTPAEQLRVSAVVSRRALAPGAEEFLPPGDTGIWLPPQRTFSSLSAARGFTAEETTHAEVAVERDFGGSTLAVRAFRQHVDDQLVTLFGAEMPGEPAAKVGHYLVGNVGDVDANGCAASLRTVLGRRVHGSLEYSFAAAQMMPEGHLRYLVLLSPSAVRSAREHVHNLSTTVEAEVPETATRVLVLYRVGNGFAHPGGSGEASSRPALDGRFDVQVRQSLPFMNFSSARWEMLLAVRNFFRETGPEQSVYDELLVVRPPKRVVGGVTLRF